MDKKLLYMGIAGLILLILMLICGGICAVVISRAYRSHTQEIDVPQSSIRAPYRVSCDSHFAGVESAHFA